MLRAIRSRISDLARGICASQIDNDKSEMYGCPYFFISSHLHGIVFARFPVDTTRLLTPFLRSSTTGTMLAPRPCSPRWLDCYVRLLFSKCRCIVFVWSRLHTN